MSRRAAAPLVFIRTASGLVPATAFDAEELDKVTIGAEVEVTIHQRRSLKNLRHFWVTMSNIVKSGAVPFPTAALLVEALKMSCGLTELRQTIGGAPYFAASSIAIEAMGEEQFKEFKRDAFALIASHYGIDPVKVEKEAA